MVSRPSEFDVALCLSGFVLIAIFLCLGGWMAWSLWSACDDSGLQMRSRVCGAQANTPCVGNNTQRRDCNEIPGESVTSQIHTVPVPKCNILLPEFLRRQLVSFAALNIPKIHCMLFTYCIVLLGCFWQEKLCDAFKRKLVSLYINYIRLSSNFFTAWLWSL